MKYDLNQTIFYMMDNKVCSAKIISRMCTESIEQAPKQLIFGDSTIEYFTCHGIILEHEAFASKEELIASL